ncbi:type VI immunity family protein [Polyangium sp. y55x31]|uniref:type VI immunity family protein n=1 Tax=Polyangium sp. y55x31 TaxID=3042688 RepID=UPI002482B8A4|nr:type VI immunity family protein [Polyangium sp. y55x31]MDI1483583.1 DUF3396 domain-containing protein [Polyangium sp. y55x31]
MSPDEPTKIALRDLHALAAEHIRISLALTMYFKEPLASFPDAIGQVLEAYLEHAEPHLRWYADWEDTKFRPAEPERLRLPAQLLEQPKFRKKNLGWLYLGGESFNDLTDWHLHGKHQVEYPSKLSFLRLAFPVDHWYPNYQAFAAWVRRVAALVPVFHGYAGFMFEPHQDPGGARHVQSEHIYPLAMRFHGIEVEAPSLTDRSCYSSIKGVNWITLVSEPLLDPLGGIHMTTAALERAGGLTVDRMPWGLYIQAGDEPGIGDVNQDPKPLPLYRKVNRILRPIRTSTHFQLGDDEYHKSFGMSGTLRWLRRFDDTSS